MTIQVHWLEVEQGELQPRLRVHWLEVEQGELAPRLRVHWLEVQVGTIAPLPVREVSSRYTITAGARSLDVASRGRVGTIAPNARRMEITA